MQAAVIRAGWAFSALGQGPSQERRKPRAGKQQRSFPYLLARSGDDRLAPRNRIKYVGDRTLSTYVLTDRTDGLPLTSFRRASSELARGRAAASWRRKAAVGKHHGTVSLMQSRRGLEEALARFGKPLKKIFNHRQRAGQFHQAAGLLQTGTPLAAAGKIRILDRTAPGGHAMGMGQRVHRSGVAAALKYEDNYKLPQALRRRAPASEAARRHYGAWNRSLTKLPAGHRTGAPPTGPRLRGPRAGRGTRHPVRSAARLWT